MAERASPIDEDNRVTLLVSGMAYSGWKNTRIQQSIEQLSGVFTVDVSERWPDQTDSFAIEPGAACTVKIGEDEVINGYVDQVQVNLTPTSHTISISGRDKTGDLVDCSAPAREWAGAAFETVVNELCAPFGIAVNSQLETADGAYKSPKVGKTAAKKIKASKGGSKLGRKATNTGETVHKLLEKLAKTQGVLLVSDRTGGLLITRAGLGGKATDVLKQGDNLRSMDYERSFSQLYSEIVVKGQSHGAVATTAGPVNLASFAKTGDTVKPAGTVSRANATANPSAQRGVSSAPVATVTSPLRYRPLIIIAEEQADGARCKARAQWEAGMREAKSKRLRWQVQGWRQSDGQLWQINTLARVDCKAARIDELMLISALEYTIDASGGTVCNLTLCPPGAYEVLAEIPSPVAATPASRPTGARTNLASFPRSAGR